MALQIEDHYNAAASTPISLVSLQFLFYDYSTLGECSTPPTIIGVRSNQGKQEDACR